MVIQSMNSNKKFHSEFGIKPKDNPMKCAKFIKQKISEFKKTEKDSNAFTDFLSNCSKTIYSLISDL